MTPKGYSERIMEVIAGPQTMGIRMQMPEYLERLFREAQADARREALEEAAKVLGFMPCGKFECTLCHGAKEIRALIDSAGGEK